MLWGALTNFPCKLRLKIFLRPGGADAPTAPPGYAYDCAINTLLLSEPNEDYYGVDETNRP